MGLTNLDRVQQKYNDAADILRDALEEANAHLTKGVEELRANFERARLDATNAYVERMHEADKDLVALTAASAIDGDERFNEGVEAALQKACGEAANAIDRLTAELTRKDAALNAVADALEQINIVTSHDAELASQIFATIRAALTPRNQEKNNG